ncbi:PREDICTED: C3a anaphylatoxin chemotactic receptor-like [Nanorana parkeri]|uniref:C3a anaphylatoxin chemotactic receptor-like n=1 Tax=Nanorana parkeri TaxID=125878 RepID=UPI000853FE43|nr:PREDICTED: C3a anaphylatoxin chemotactic receptor-like [Nanorana parkeri]
MSNANTDQASTIVSIELVFAILIMIITALVGIPGNFLVLWITGVKVKRTPMNIWFWNLALADMTCCLTFPFFIVQFFYDEWLYGPALCKIIPSTIVFTMFASIFTLVAISIDRCILVIQPVWAKNHRTLRMVWIICLAIWTLSFLMCLPVVLYRTTFTEKNLTQCGYRQMDLQHSNGSDINVETYVSFPDKTVTYTRIIFGFLIPLLIISASYARLASKIKQTRFVKVGRKTTKVVICIVIAFCVSWTPYHIMGIILLYSNKENPVVTNLDYLSQVLAYSNSCINPILYVFLGKDMKSRVRQSLRELMENVFTEELTKSTDHRRAKSRQKKACN